MSQWPENIELTHWLRDVERRIVELQQSSRDWQENRYLYPELQRRVSQMEMNLLSISAELRIKMDVLTEFLKAQLSKGGSS